MNDLFKEFLLSPTFSSFLRVRQAVIDGASYDPTSTELDAAWSLITQSRFREAWDLLIGKQEKYLLSLRYYACLGIASESLGDRNAEPIMHLGATRCLQGLLSTGDGSRRRAYLILRSWDVCDVLESLHKKVVNPEAMQEPTEFLVMRCDDRSEVCFDMRDMWRALLQQR